MTDDLFPLAPEEGVERFLGHREPSVRASTLENARHRLAVFLEWCEEEDVENLNVLSGRDLDSFVRWRQPQVAPITLQKQLSSVRQALRYWASIEAVQEGLAEKLHAPELPDGAESRDVHLPATRAEFILEELDRYRFGTRRHVIMAILWRTAMRRGALRAIDVDDLDREQFVVEIRHRPETETQLKNGKAGERDVYLGPTWFGIIDGYLEHPDRPEVLDDHGRRPLITTKHGRASEETIYDTVHRATQPCRYGDCPHDRDPDECPAVGAPSSPSKCPSSVSPHAVRRGRITPELNGGRPPDAISKRADVSTDVLERHYDARTKREKMDVRKRFFEEDR
jgi:site-specific recombinase XerD